VVVVSVESRASSRWTRHRWWSDGSTVEDVASWLL